MYPIGEFDLYHDFVINAHVLPVMDELRGREAEFSQVISDRLWIDPIDPKNFMLNVSFYTERGNLAIPAFSIWRSKDEDRNTVYFSVNVLGSDDVNYALTTMLVRDLRSGEWQYETYVHSDVLPQEVDLITDVNGQYIASSCLDLLEFHNFAIRVISEAGLVDTNRAPVVPR